MHPPQLTPVFEAMDRARATLRASVGRIPAARREQAPAPGRWSVAQLVEHLALVERRMTGLISSASAQGVDSLAPDSGADASGHGSIQPMPDEVRVKMTDRRARREASEPIQPRGLGYDEAWRSLEGSRQALRSALEAADPRSLNIVVTTHPVLGALTAFQCGEVVALHEERHSAQVDEIGAQLASVTA